MTDRGDATKAASRIIRERALAILRDTRAKIDPALLAVVKERLSHANTKPTVEPELKQGLYKRNYKQRPEKAETPKTIMGDIVDENGMVAVDRQKIAQIVLQYMKNREDGQKH